MDDAQQPATRGDLWELEERLEERLDKKFGQRFENIEQKLTAQTAELRAEMDARFERVYLEIGASAARTANVVIDHIRHELRSYDDRYRDLPARVDRLEKHLGLTSD